MSNIIALPTKVNVEGKWLRYSNLCRRLNDNPALADNTEFQQLLNEAETDWFSSFALWVRCA